MKKILLSLWISFWFAQAHGKALSCSHLFGPAATSSPVKLERYTLAGVWPAKKLDRSEEYHRGLQEELREKNQPLRNFDQEALAVRESLIRFFAGLGWDISQRISPVENIVVNESIETAASYSWVTHTIEVDTQLPSPATLLHEFIHSTAYLEVAPFTLIDGFQRVRRGFSEKAIEDENQEVDPETRRGGFGLLEEGYTEYLALYLIQSQWPSIPLLKDYIPFEEAYYITPSLFFEALIAEISSRSGLSFEEVFFQFIQDNLTGTSKIKELIATHFGSAALGAIAALNANTTWRQLVSVIKANNLLNAINLADIESRFRKWNKGDNLALRFPRNLSAPNTP